MPSILLTSGNIKNLLKAPLALLDRHLGAGHSGHLPAGAQCGEQHVCHTSQACNEMTLELSPQGRGEVSIEKKRLWVKHQDKEPAPTRQRTGSGPQAFWMEVSRNHQVPVPWLWEPCLWGRDLDTSRVVSTQEKEVGLDLEEHQEDMAMIRRQLFRRDEAQMSQNERLNARTRHTSCSWRLLALS